MTDQDTAAKTLATDIIGAITRVNEDLVAEQYKMNSDLERINALLVETDVDSAFLLSLLKAVNIITANIMYTPDIPDAERISSVVGMQVSLAVILREKLHHLGHDQVVPVIAALTNLLTILEIPQGTESEATPTEEIETTD